MSRRKKYSIEEVKKFAEEKGGKCLSDIYIHNKSNLTWECGKCKHIFNNCLKNVMYLDNWCPSCSGKLNNNIEVIRKFAREKGGECLSDSYKNNKTNLIWKCGSCNNTWNARFDRIKSGTWCPKCNESYGEKKVKEILNERNFKYEREYIFDKLKNRRFDFFLNDYNTVIEFDGIQHFQINGHFCANNEILQKNHKYDLEKTLFCKQNNIKIIRIDYKSINNTEYIIEEGLKTDVKLIFSDWSMYDYIIDNIKEIEFLVFLTGVGE